MIIIYLITNLINNKKYVGQTAQTLETRWIRHCWKSESRKNMVITHAIHKYGKGNFKIEQIDCAETLDQANEKEVYWANFYNSFCPNGYNNKAGGRKCLTLSEETRKKIANRNRGRKASPETIKRLSESHKGLRVSEEAKQKLSEHFKGKQPHENTRKAASQKNSKRYILRSPEGELVEINNMREFCEKYGFQRSCMSNLVTGKTTIYKGWMLVQDLGFIREEVGSRRNKI